MSAKVTDKFQTLNAVRDGNPRGNIELFLGRNS
jgi:hypothetical protein